MKLLLSIGLIFTQLSVIAVNLIECEEVRGSNGTVLTNVWYLIEPLVCVSQKAKSRFLHSDNPGKVYIRKQMLPFGNKHLASPGFFLAFDAC